MKIISVCIMVAVMSAGVEAAFMSQDTSHARPEVQTEYLSVPVQAGYRQTEWLREIVRKTYASDSMVSIRTQRYQHYAASQIKKHLIAQGIAAERVRIDRAVTGTLPPDELEVAIETMAFRLEPCHYNNQDYRYSVKQKPGCALKHNLQRALVNPARSLF